MSMAFCQRCLAAPRSFEAIQRIETYHVMLTSHRRCIGSSSMCEAGECAALVSTVPMSGVMEEGMSAFSLDPQTWIQVWFDIQQDARPCLRTQ